MADASIVDVTSVEVAVSSAAEVVVVGSLVVVSLVGKAVELVTPVPAPVADASIVDVVSVEVAVSLTVVADTTEAADVVGSVAVVSVVVASSVLAIPETSETTLETSETRSLVREVSNPVPVPVVAAAVSIVDVVSVAVYVADSVVVVSVADAVSVEETIIPLDV